ncbi:adhesin/invasin [Kluyvera sp. 1366]
MLGHDRVSNSPSKLPALIRRFVLAQIAVQVGVALTPFWAITVQAALNSQEEDAYYGRAASHFSTIGQAAQAGNLSGMAAQQATGAATQEIQQWMQKFGTARVELGTDDRFKPRTGSADLLVPLYKSDSRLLFTQNGLRNVDGQFTGNFGLGQRHFTDSQWMLGYNAFYDQNFSRGHKRVGTGVEAWRDYLKLSGNGYWRLSGWRNSVDVEDYDARPANGFDVRAEAWLPSYPSLGGRLMYEQYYGNEVALLSKDNRQKDPRAVTAGLSWTPVPLVSFNVDHKKSGSQNDTVFGLQLSWQLGQSLASQLDPAGVGAKRTLVGSGMDLVERNNTIVLEYRKQQLIELTLPKEIAGQSGSTQPIAYTLKAKYGLEKIVWNDAAVIAAGGKVMDAGNGVYQLVMPKYLAGTANTHLLSGVAYDTRNNASKVATTKVTVTRPAVSATNSTTTSSVNVLPADGATTSDIIITLADEQGQPVSGLGADLKVEVEEQADPIQQKASNKVISKAKAAPVSVKAATLGDVTERESGVYALTLTAGTRASVAIVSPALDTLALPSVSVRQVSDAASAVVKEGDIQLVMDNVIANGKNESQAKARVTDAYGNPVPDVSVAFTLSGTAQVAAGSSLTATSDKDGYVTLLFTNTVAEAVTVTATTPNGGSARVNARFIADSSSATLPAGNLSVDRNSALADGQDSVTFSARIIDANGNPVPGVPVTWGADGGKLSTESSDTDTTGIASVKLTSVVATPLQVSATVNNGNAVNAPLVNFTADSGNLDASKSVLSAAQPAIVADGADNTLINLTLKDRNGNPVSGQTIVFFSSLSGTAAGGVTDHGDGSYSASFSGTKSGTATITASVNGTAFSVAAVNISLSADSGNLDSGKSTLNATKSSIVANGTDASGITLTLKDRNDNPVIGQTVVFASSLSGSTLANVTDNGDGTYTANLTGTKAGSASITATVNSNSFNVAAVNVSLTADSENLDATQSAFSASKGSVVANGADASVITLTLKDRNGNVVSGQTVAFASSLSGTSPGSVTDNGDGTYTANFTGTKSGSATITVTINGKAFAVAAVNVSLTADTSNLDGANSTLGASKASVVANGIDGSVITLTLKDRNDNVVSGQAVVFYSSLNGSGVSSVTDKGNGTYVATLTGTKAGSTSITVSVNGVGFGVTATSVSLTADSDNLDAGKSTLGASKATIVADGTDGSVITLTLKDANDNKVSGEKVALSSSLAGSMVSSVVDNGDGTYSATLTGTAAGDTSITAMINDSIFSVTPATITLTADSSNLDAGKSLLTASRPVIVADGTDGSAITLTLKDRNDNPVSGQSVAFMSNMSGSTIDSVRDNGDGTYTGILTGTKAGSASITVTINNSSFAVAAVNVSMTADSSNLDAGKSLLNASRPVIVADGTDGSVITLTLKDRNDNGVNGQAVAFVSSLPGSAVSSAADNGDGTYSATLTGTTAGATSISATINSSNFAVIPATVTLTADSGNLDAGKSLLNASRPAIVADGADGSVITLTLKDRNDNAVRGQVVMLSSGLAGSAVSSVTDNGDGTYTGTLTGSKAGDTSITAMVNDSNFAVAAVNVSLTADSSNLDTGRSLLTASRPAIVADGADGSVITLTLRDRNDNAVSGQAVAFVSSLNDSAFGSVLDHGDGTYTATLTGTKSGRSSITVTIDGKAFAVTATDVTLMADSAHLDGTKSTLSASESSIVANGNATSILRLVLKDRNDNPVSGQSVTFVTSLSGSNVGSVTDNNDGTYSAELTGSDYGSTTIGVEVNGAGLSMAGTSVTFLALSGIETAGHIFSLSEGFPQTVYQGATFQLKINGSTPASGQYTFTSDNAAVSVTATGKVTVVGSMTAAKTARLEVKHNATTVSMGSYTLNPVSWFINNGSTPGNYSAVSSFCSTNGMSVPTSANVTNATTIGSDGTRAVGTLYGEWGGAANGGFGNYGYRTSTNTGGISGERDSIALATGNLFRSTEGTTHRMMCVKAL